MNENDFFMMKGLLLSIINNQSELFAKIYSIENILKSDYMDSEENIKIQEMQEELLIKITEIHNNKSIQYAETLSKQLFLNKNLETVKN